MKKESTKKAENTVENIIDRNMAFEAAMEELEKTVAKLETGEVPLEEALELYKRGIALVEHCNAKLNEAEGIVSILYKDSSGELKETEFEVEG